MQLIHVFNVSPHEYAKKGKKNDLNDPLQMDDNAIQFSAKDAFHMIT